MSAAPDGPPMDELENLPVLEEAVISTDAQLTLDAEHVSQSLASNDLQESATPTQGKFILPHAGHALLWVLLMFGSQLLLGLVIGI